MKYLVILVGFVMLISSHILTAQSTIEPNDIIVGRDQFPTNGEFISGNFFFFDGNSGAFRGGCLSDISFTGWSPDSLGSGSFAYGHNVTAAGSIGATALGIRTIASGSRGATALGSFTNASGSFGATALGNRTTASGDQGATAMGSMTTASGGLGATALGSCTTASGLSGATALGHSTIASGSSGAMAAGYSTNATGNSCVVVGVYNDTIVATGTLVGPSSPLFIVGNGAFSNRSNAMIVRKDGRLGIGTNSPNGLTHISAGASGDAHLIIEADTDNTGGEGDNPRISLRQDGNTVKGFLAMEGNAEATSLGTLGNAFIMGVEEDNAALQFITDDRARITIEPGGHVGIGTNAPNDHLDVIGNIDATGCIQTDDAGSIGGTCISDRRLKRNITYLKNSLAKISQLKPAHFEWRESLHEISQEKGASVGLIAQEVEEIFPHLVKEADNGYKKVRYDIELQMHMIQAIKELDEENYELHSKLQKVENQSARIQKLEEQIKALQRIITKNSNNK